MRISSEQIGVFHQIIKSYLQNNSYQLFLYGSRTQDHLKGGDIDLLIVTSATGASLFQSHKFDILVQIKKNKAIGQRRIDLKSCTPQDIETDLFLKSIQESLVLI